MRESRILLILTVVALWPCLVYKLKECQITYFPRRLYLQAIHSGKWGTDAKTLFVGAGDHNLRMFSVPDEAVPME